MLLASKYEEMYAPEIGDFVYITDQAYDKSTIRRTESKMFEALGYQLGDPLCLHFLRRNSKAARVSSIREKEYSQLIQNCSLLPSFLFPYYTGIFCIFWLIIIFWLFFTVILVIGVVVL